MGTIIFLPCDLDLGVFNLFLENFNLANNFWTVSARGLIFHTSIPCVNILTLWPWSWSLTLFCNFYIGNNFWTVGARAFVFHMSFAWDKTFQLVPTILTLWTWTLTYFFKALSLRITFEQWDLEFWFFSWIQKIVTLTLEFDLLFGNFNFVNTCNIWIVRAKAFIFHMSNLSIRTFPWVPTFLTLWPWPWSLTYILNTLILLIKFE